MSAPDLDSVGTDLYQSLAPVARDDQAYDYQLAYYCGALGAMFQPVGDWIRDTDDGPGWSVLLDLERAPAEALGWLGQFVGVTVDDSLSEAGQREQVRAEQGFRRGSPAAIAAAAQQTLTGAKRVVLSERTGGDAYALTVITYTAETPDPAATEAAVRSALVKPAGIVLTYLTHDGQDFDQLLAGHPTFDDVKADYSTFDSVRDDVP